MIAAIIAPEDIPKFVHPPVPGESHVLYGDSHLGAIKLPTHATTTSGPRPVSHSTDLILGDESSDVRSQTTRGLARDMSGSLDDHQASGTSTAVRAGQHGGSSDDTLWAQLVEACAEGHAEQVEEILSSSPLLKDSIDNISSATGMNPLHFAASRGHEPVVRVLIDQAGAGVDVPDREGESALLKASYTGNYSVVCFLLKRGANVHQRDKDGWTALHNASSKGFIDTAQVLLEKGEADINARSKMGHTPLINAASKGDVAMVLYFLNHAHANPLLKNNFLETAYDVAAANSEAYLCDILQSSEKLSWKNEYPADQPYDSLSFHSTILVSVYENQRASASFPLSFMAPKFSASALSQQDVCGPWSLPNGRPSTMDDVHLPLVATGSARTNMQRGWFWLTEWVMDKTDPNCDSEGWQYSKSLMELNQTWTKAVPTSGSNWLSLNEVGNYSKRAGLALRQVEGFVNPAQELARYRQAIAILLQGIKADTDPASKVAATTLIQEYLTHAEELSHEIQELEIEANQPETPRPQLASQLSDGSSSPNELRSITLQKSRPADLDTMDDIVAHSQLGLESNQSPPESDDNSSSSASSRLEEDIDDTTSAHSAKPTQPTEEDEEAAVSTLVHDQGNTDDTPTESVPDQVSTETEEQEHTADLESPFIEDHAENSVDSDIPPLEESSEYTESQTVETSSSDPTESSEQASVSSETRRDSQIEEQMVTMNTSPSTPTLAAPSPSQGQFPVARLTRSPRPTGSSSNTVSSNRSASTVDSASQSPTTQSTPSGINSHDLGSDTLRAAGTQSNQTRTTELSQSLQSTALSSNTAASRSPSSYQSRTLPHSQRPQQQQTQQQHPLAPPFEPKWESDHKASECRECHRKFSLWLRRHHCRRCGRVFCDRCSSRRATLHPSMVVYDPSSSEAYIQHQAQSRRGTLQSYRVTAAYGRDRGRVNHGGGYGVTNPHHAAQARRSPSTSSSSSSMDFMPAPMVRNASSSSLMSECPVCGAILAGLEGGKPAQEAHVQDCLEGKTSQGSGAINTSTSFLQILLWLTKSARFASKSLLQDERLRV
ncbi:hypothetical protein BGW38_010874 [Lunasporangiospora selenospora]|uniref:FYVE-type domain-containing protein n=1 Tax=Lunasporangiospora selenospora TaxID=979761 RepID=A0A9P6FVW9_9FUNG|nr:hypothetical protein BGW38_010874 [Lunasporangiospora selenospora]